MVDLARSSARNNSALDSTSERRITPDDAAETALPDDALAPDALRPDAGTAGDVEGADLTLTGGGAGR